MKLAEQLNLNIPQFKKDLQKIELVVKVDLDCESGIMSSVDGTPSFFVNDKKFDRSASVDTGECRFLTLKLL